MKYFLIVGEKSGDLHASKLMRELKKVDPQADFSYFGGDAMQAQGGTLLRHHQDLAFMGFWDVILHLRKIVSYIKECKQAIAECNPDLIIGVDYSSFNLKIAQWAASQNLLYYHYIAPKTWAWKESRLPKIKKYFKRTFCIFPFEKDYFAKFDYPVHYVGHPVVEAVKEHQVNPHFLTDNKLSNKPIIALLPGSRKQEIDRMLSFMASIASSFSSYQFVVGAVTSYPKSYEQGIKEKYPVSIVYDQTYDLLAHATAAVAKSGTVTLEAALFHVPQVTIYLTSNFNYFLLKAILPKRLTYVTPVNLIDNKEVVKELLRKKETTAPRLKKELQAILGDDKEKMLEGYREVEKLLSPKSKVAHHLANLIYQSYKEDTAATANTPARSKP